MTSRIATQIVTFALAFVTLAASTAWGARYRVELQRDGKVLSSRTIDLKNPAKGDVIHTEGGIALEIKDKTASCGVFLSAQNQTGGHQPDKANVIVTIIENSKTPDMKSVQTNSGLLSKRSIPLKDQDVTPGAEGTRKVSVDSAKLNRSCTVSVI